MHRRSAFRFLIMFFMLVVVFLQPNIYCNNKKDMASDGKGNNPLFTKAKDVGLWETPAAPDQIIASETKLKANAKEVGDDDMQYLEKADQKNGVYIFSDDATGVGKLPAGSFVFFRNHSVRKIVSTEKKDDKIIVKTAKCKFTDVFSDAHLHFKEHYDWKDNRNALLQKFDVSFGQLAYAQDPISQSLSWEGELRGYKVKVSIRPEGGRKLNFEINIQKRTSANITFKGFISDFDNETEITVANSELQLFRSENSNLHGEVEVEFAAVELGDDGEMLNIPWTMFERPILIAGIPFVFKVKANAKVFPAIPAGASSQGHFKFTYDSNTGFRYEGRGVSPQGTVTGETFQVLGETLSAGTMGAGLGLGVEFPRFEIASLGEIIVPYFLMNTYLDTQLDTYRPCQMGNMKGKLVVGLSLSFFGASYNAERELWKAQKRWEREGSRCPPEEN
ncbi:MAG TPA: hypothetical protein VJU78_21065 [Chitinophagaceae bacterium]|nr:hypothetical protein [Chitinophagaceae bacterium]